MLIKKSSGYSENESNWSLFLREWRSVKKSNSILDGFKYENVNIESIRVKQKLESLNLLDAPKSYLNFLAANTQYKDEKNETGMLSINEIDFLKNVDKNLYDIFISGDIESTDDEYFSYGESQDDAAFKVSMCDNLILIGIGCDGDKLFLNNSARTIDQECECVFHTHASSFRTLSFAHMMRNLSVYECGNLDSYPPYADELLNNGFHSLVKSRI